MRDFVNFLHLAGNPWKHQIDHGFLGKYGQVCLGMPKVLRNDNLPIFQEIVELLCEINCLAILVSSDQACLGNPKVHKNSRLEISLKSVY